MAELMTTSMIDTGDRWVISWTDADINACCFDFAVEVRISEGSDTWGIRIEQTMTLTSADGVDDVVEPEGEPGQLLPVLRCLRQPVSEVVAHKDGQLVLHLSDKSRIHVPADEEYEAWELYGPRGIRIVSMPGGDLAVWGNESEDAN